MVEGSTEPLQVCVCVCRGWGQVPGASVRICLLSALSPQWWHHGTRAPNDGKNASCLLHRLGEGTGAGRAGEGEGGDRMGKEGWRGRERWWEMQDESDVLIVDRWDRETSRWITSVAHKTVNKVVAVYFTTLTDDSAAHGLHSVYIFTADMGKYCAKKENINNIWLKSRF